MRYLDWRNLVQRKIGTNSQILLQKLVQSSQIVAQKQAWTANVGCYFLWALMGCC